MKKTVHTSNAPAAVGPYSQAVLADSTLYVSGQIPMDPGNGKIIQGGIRQQTTRVLQNITAILDEAGYGLNEVVKCTCLLSDMANFKEMNEVYAGFFPTNPPARAAFAVKELPLGALVEIECIAVKES